MSDMKKLLSILSESTTSSASIANGTPGAKGFIKRSNDTIFAEDSAEQPPSPETSKSPANFGLWKNSSVIGREQTKLKKTAVDKTKMYPQIAESYKQRGQSDIDDLASSRRNAERNAGLNEPDEFVPNYGNNTERDFGTWYFTYQDGSIVIKDGRPLLASSTQGVRDVIAIAKKHGIDVKSHEGAPPKLSESGYKTPKGMDDWSDEEWDQWDDMVNRVGQRANAQREREAAKRKPESNDDKGSVNEVSPSTISRAYNQRIKNTDDLENKFAKSRDLSDRLAWRKAKIKQDRMDDAISNRMPQPTPDEQEEYNNWLVKNLSNDMLSTTVGKDSIEYKDKSHGSLPDPAYIKRLKAAGWQESVEEATGDAKFDSMMGDITSPEALDTNEALALIRDLVYNGGASYEEALHQASVSFGINRGKLHALYKKQGMMEGFGGRVDSPVSQAITRRILNQYPGLLKYGPDKVMAAIDEVSEWHQVGPDDEIGSSDVSAWVKEVARYLQTGAGEGINESNEDRVGFHLDSERAYQAVMSKFGDLVDQDESSGVMYVPRKVWSRLEQVALDADGIGAIEDGGEENPEHYSKELSEEVIADRLKNELALFKSGTKAKDKAISKKPASKEIQKKKPE